jgi:hypothetical protein
VKLVEIYDHDEIDAWAETIEGHEWSAVDIRDNNVTFRSQTEEIRFDFRNGVSAEVVVDLKVFEISFIRGSVYSIKEPLKVKVFFDDQYRTVILKFIWKNLLDVEHFRDKISSKKSLDMCGALSSSFLRYTSPTWRLKEFFIG